MKRYYTLITNFMNGTVILATEIANFTSKELAEKTKDAVDYENRGSCYPAISTIKETRVYESEDEVPILKK